MSHVFIWLLGGLEEACKHACGCIDAMVNDQDWSINAFLEDDY